MKKVFFAFFLLLFLWGKLFDVKIITAMLISVIFLNKIYNAGWFSFNNSIIVLVVHQRIKENIKAQLSRDFEGNYFPKLMKSRNHIFASLNMHTKSTKFNIAHHFKVVKMNFSKIEILQNFVELCLMGDMFTKDGEPDWKIFFDENEVIVVKFTEYYKSDIFKLLNLSEIEPQRDLFNYFKLAKGKLRNMFRTKNEENNSILNVIFFKEHDEIKEKQDKKRLKSYIYEKCSIIYDNFISKKRKNESIIENQLESHIETEIFNFRNNNEIEKIYVVDGKSNFKYKLIITKMNAKEFASGILNLN